MFVKSRDTGISEMLFQNGDVDQMDADKERSVVIESR